MKGENMKSTSKKLKEAGKTLGHAANVNAPHNGAKKLLRATTIAAATLVLGGSFELMGYRKLCNQVEETPCKEYFLSVDSIGAAREFESKVKLDGEIAKQKLIEKLNPEVLKDGENIIDIKVEKISETESSIRIFIENPNTNRELTMQTDSLVGFEDLIKTIELSQEISKYGPLAIIAASGRYLQETAHPEAYNRHYHSPDPDQDRN